MVESLRGKALVDVACGLGHTLAVTGTGEAHHTLPATPINLVTERKPAHPAGGIRSMPGVPTATSNAGWYL